MKVMVTQSPAPVPSPNVVRFALQPRSAASMPLTTLPAAGQFTRWTARPWTGQSQSVRTFWEVSNLLLPSEQAKVLVGTALSRYGTPPFPLVYPRQIVPVAGGEYQVIEQIPGVGRIVQGEVEYPTVRYPNLPALINKIRMLYNPVY